MALEGEGGQERIDAPYTWRTWSPASAMKTTAGQENAWSTGASRKRVKEGTEQSGDQTQITNDAVPEASGKGTRKGGGNGEEQVV